MIELCDEFEMKSNIKNGEFIYDECASFNIIPNCGKPTLYYRDVINETKAYFEGIRRGSVRD